jgi:hypothetical protein
MSPLEFPLHRESAMCCGAGGACRRLEDTVGRRIRVLPVGQTLPAVPKVVARPSTTEPRFRQRGNR